MQDAADRAQRAAGDIEEAVRRLENIFTDGYGGNGVRLLEVMGSENINELLAKLTTTPANGEKG